MLLVEKHVIKKHNSYFKEIDNLCFLAKNLYNYANYLIRQSFIFEGKYLNYNAMEKLCQGSADYKALPAKVAQQILMRLHEAWQGFFSSLASYKEEPEKFFCSPRIPSYLHKTNGRFPCIYTIQAISKKYLKHSQIKPSKTNIVIPTNVNQIRQVRLVPKGSYYVFEVVYKRLEEPQIHTSDGIAGIDIGLNNLAAVTSNIKGFKPILVNGKPLNKINAYYHKIRSKLQSLLPSKHKTSHQIQNLTRKRNFKIYDYLHKSSRLIIDYLAANQIGTLIIGHNDKWKQSIGLGKRNNQNFVSIPFDRFISMLKYKAKLIGIKVIITEESYTSKCSFIDEEPLSK
ncbi:RNA-guided endonuclease InsQ/TnpB family protein [Mastigocoleus testarum]|uniref:Transposase n=2 Tax=Mastigocoleus testarum BC008 TaxID=371196 RepID=A0A0V7ZJA3_9CYAN|nr:RNA-guided endonuclease TnpB family protein [Mastigocoleus testarum]KST64514.1 transposase [Mastigocoleus testarum BC008]